MFDELVYSVQQLLLVCCVVCWDRDGRESFVVTKVFDVERLESDLAATPTDDLDFIREIPVAEVRLRLSTISYLLVCAGIG